MGRLLAIEKEAYMGMCCRAVVLKVWKHQDIFIQTFMRLLRRQGLNSPSQPLHLHHSKKPPAKMLLSPLSIIKPHVQPTSDMHQ